ncbi:TonB-dependent receptor [Asticcacaulis sp. BYS171W]|uniref:TonB-dependent receptor n=1 Tax=Asticcacaulis aquaticus TaxID=2984212 RepID=A0ABT5HWV0_9CAUL|nr:TonB-dependent receptor [Asticcacaulis aquaticus]MDC7684552.1 TonB-dependent receptor [Asticcacaulis aquaticus]
MYPFNPRAHAAWKAALLGATVIGGLPFAALAQEAAPAQDDATTVVVTGFKKSYADALRAKKNNIEITDGISSDGLGRFPDLNVGEALQRIPGVQINREAEGRNATINVRGMPGSYAQTTLNGVAFAPPPSLANDQGTPLGAFNSDIFSAFVVEKSPMANAPSGGLSGNVDMQIAPALSRKDGGIFKASYEYNELGGKVAPAFTVGYNKHFSDTLAVFGTIAYKKENFRRDTLRFNGYSRLTPTLTGLTNAQFAATYGDYYSAAACPTSGSFCQTLSGVLGTTAFNTSTTGSKGNTGVYALDSIRQYTRTNEGDLWTASGGVEWKPNANTKVGLVGYYTDRDLPKTTQHFLINAVWAGAGTMTPSGAPVQTSDGRWVYETVTHNNFPGKISTRQYGQHQKAGGIVANAEWSHEGWKLDAVLALSKGENSSIETELNLQTNPATTGTNGLSGTITTGFGDLDRFSYTVTPSPANKIFSTGWVWQGTSNSINPTASDPAGYLQPGGIYYFSLSGSESFAEETVNSAQFNAERFVEFGPIKSLKGGVMLTQNKFQSRGFRNMGYGLQTQNLTQDMIYTPSFVGDFMNGDAKITTNWVTFDAERTIAALQPVAVYTASGGGLTTAGFNIQYADGAFADYNYNTQNDVTQAYIQAKYETEILGHRVRGNVGTRYEATDNKIDSFDVVTPFANSVGSITNFKWQTIENSYHYWLPSAIFAADITDDIVLRGAYYKTYVRPQARQYSPVTRITPSQTLNATLSTPTVSVYDTSVRIGNNKLKPYLADSYDLSVEWYNRPGGVISLAYFKKIITGRVVATSDPAILCPSDGSTWGFGPLSWDGQYCTATSLSSSSKVVHVNASGAYNLDSDTTVEGLEFNIQQNFDFLPGFWRYLGGSLNYAYTDSKSPAIAPFPGISKHATNAILFYETPKFGVRAVYNYRTDYPLNANGTYTGAARSVKARGQLDLSASYNLTDKVTLSLDAYNVTNEKRYEYENDERFVRWIDYDGRTITLTARAVF